MRPGTAPASDTEIAEIHRMAEFGSRQYQFRLYQIYAAGKGVEKDEAVALQWLHRAAESGYGPAEKSLALRYLQGRGLPMNKFLGMQCLRDAAAHGQLDAEYVMGMLRLEDALSSTEREEGIHLLQKAARQGHPGAQVRLGMMYFLGENVETDRARAVQLFRSAAEKGDPRGLFYLGRLLGDEGGTESASTALELLKKAAEGGYGPAQNDLAVLMLMTQEEGAEGQISEAVAWLRKAARSEPAARVNLWVLSLRKKVEPKSSRELVQWLKSAAVQGDARAQKLLGDHYLRCEHTSPHLTAYACARVASFWHHRAARQGSGEAQVAVPPSSPSGLQKSPMTQEPFSLKLLPID